MKLNLSHPIVAGGTSALVTTVIYQPLDFLKTQIQEPKHDTSKQSIRIVTSSVINQYSIFRLWRGLIPSIFRAVPGSAFYFYLLDLFKKNIPEHRQTIFSNGASAFLARGMADMAFFPSTFVKTRLESSHYSNMNMMTIIRTVFAIDGVRGFYVGLIPTLARDLPFSAIYYACYQSLRSTFAIDDLHFGKYSWLKSQFLIGFTAGIVASFVTQPADVIKTYRQVAPREHHTIRVTMKNIVQRKGYTGFTSGFILRASRRTLVAATTWTLYEVLLHKK